MLSRGVARGLAAAATGAMLLPGAALAQTSPFVGEWRLNAAMSKAPPGETPPKSLVTKIERADPLHVRWTINLVDAQGHTSRSTFDLPANGEFYPVGTDTTGAIRLNGDTLQASFRNTDGQTDEIRCSVAAGGRGMTCNGQTSAPGGAKSAYVDVFDRA